MPPFREDVTPKQKDECHQNIKWKNEKGIKILGVKFFPDDLRTKYNWSKTRKLPLRGNILLLDEKGMAKMVYKIN